MGWQARLPKDQKPEFKRTCNKCGDTGVRKTFIAMDGARVRREQKCKCILLIEAAAAAAKKAADEAIAQPNVGNQA